MCAVQKTRTPALTAAAATLILTMTGRCSLMAFPAEPLAIAWRTTYWTSFSLWRPDEIRGQEAIMSAALRYGIAEPPFDGPSGTLQRHTSAGVQPAGAARL